MCVDRAQIHTNVRLQDGRLVEIQVRTAAMHERAERGSAAHHLYKGGLGASSSFGLLPEVSAAPHFASLTHHTLL